MKILVKDRNQSGDGNFMVFNSMKTNQIAVCRFEVSDVLADLTQSIAKWLLK